MINEAILYHYGIKRRSGRYPWGSGTRPFQDEDYGVKNLKDAKVTNLNKWRSSKDQNILYITGFSGSGKSTTALEIAGTRHKVIHLDSYSEPNLGYLQDKEFNSLFPDYDKISSAQNNPESPEVLKKFSKEYWEAVDAFHNAIQEYSRLQYDKGIGVIVEGVQVADGWLTGNDTFFSQKPTIVLSTSQQESQYRAALRDGMHMDEKIADAIIQERINYASRLQSFVKETSLELIDYDDIMKYLFG